MTGKYLNGAPADSRAARGGSFGGHLLTEDNLARIRALNAIAARRGQTLAQLALAWVLRDPRVTSALIGAARSPSWRTLAALNALSFSAEELAEIDQHASEGGVDLWKVSSELATSDLP
ncbi:aldo/keto reductase [Caulobacter segnis]